MTSAPAPNASGRRALLGAALSTGLLHRPVQAQPNAAAGGRQPHLLRAVHRIIEVRRRPADVFGLIDAGGRPGLTLESDERFRVQVDNETREPTIIHWHGQTPPFWQDGTPDMPLPVLPPGTRRDFDFVPRPGTHWMHSHLAPQEMALMAAPLVVRTIEDARADRQEVVVLLHDFSFRPFAELMAGLRATAAAHGGHAVHGAPAVTAGTVADLNDIEFDAYLANDRTLDDPQVTRVERGGRVLLRLINGAGATVFFVDLGGVPGHLLAVDGEQVRMRVEHRLGIAMGQRLDIELDIPREGGAFPIFFQREGALERTGIILATPGARVGRLADHASARAGAFGLELERRLTAAHPLEPKPARVRRDLALTGQMSPYAWGMDGRSWQDRQPLQIELDDRVEITFVNRGPMAHPMHLHGHRFQVVALGGPRFAGALRDTLHVPPGASATVAFDADNPGAWMLHCHHMPHLATGMATELRYLGTRGG
ncbi:Multicopper oxidase with three cupredoxin domains (includes cell division protein FtsP and spore coat protein CotA) [Roseomonas rosea]|uniref:Multicopper oxidase with three cupredoxin domains (Includes cell division protein FtsP and spore coat protein CotA) n=1 Tax=Muricoccus roseus TaxID=198092 RepID=A0A1M6QNN9_9PROT|nr:multicopper oxidase family protein [Roseomonas rosea]SHK21700.1 Multicopper oxidase with three cupredoxin domains (includes cell division protein FtsP and spore coat protein CotA) [Roseomonas rosea]